MEFNKELFAKELFSEKLRIQKMRGGKFGIREYAALIGLDISTLSRMINAKKTPDINNILRVCKYFNKPIDYYITK